MWLCADVTNAQIMLHFNNLNPSVVMGEKTLTRFIIMCSFITAADMNIEKSLISMHY